MKIEEKIPQSDAFENDNGSRKQPFFSMPQGKILSGLLMMAIVVIVIAFSIAGINNMSVSVGMDDDKIGISVSGQDPIFIKYHDILGIEKTDTISMDREVSSLFWNEGFIGVYENSDWGKFTMYAYSSPGEYIVIHYADGTIVLNNKTKRETDKTYSRILKYIY